MRTFVLAFAVLSLIACKGKPKPREAPGSGKVETQGSAKPKEVTLPHADGSPPIKTTAPVKPETYKKLSEMTFPGFNLAVNRVSDKYLWVYQSTIDHPIIRGSIHIWSCKNDPKGCYPVNVEEYKAKHMDELRQYLSDGVKNSTDLVFETGMTDLHGTPMIYVYQLGQVVGDGRHSEFTHSYILFYNDGENEIRALGEYKDDMMASKEAMVKSVPREDLENTAKAFLDVYSHHWQE